jgi:hypothetical protein
MLKGLYAETPTLWRPEMEMCNYICWLLLGQLVIAKSMAYLFAKGYEGKGIGEGLRFGIIMGPLLVAPNLIQYAVTPLPSSVVWAWVGTGLVQAILGGVVLSLVYKR